MSIFIHLEVVTPESVLISEDTDLVTAPGVEGYFGVMAGHAPMVTLLKPGVMTIGFPVSPEDNKVKRYIIAGGYVEVLPEKVTILTERAVAREDLDRQKIELELKEAQDKVCAIPSSDPQCAYWQNRVDFANACLGVLVGHKV
ncbi:MAG: ATP synthase F1 subunit epsilon [Magnetococcales bacterium]|nr:ATP synthase F1 subunit epsilon [Magnetococcales bacterium]